MSASVVKQLKEHFRDGVVSDHAFRGDHTVILTPSVIRAACLWLRDTDGLEFNMLSDLTAVDYLGYPNRQHVGYPERRGPRFEVVYHLYSMKFRHRIRLKVPVEASNLEIDSVHDVWGNANWCEREIYDLYGLNFVGHPDPRRILLYPEFEGHPLRKDYPKRKHQPLIRRPRKEIEEAMQRRPGQNEDGKRSLL